MRKRVIIVLIGVSGCARTFLDLGSDGGVEGSRPDGGTATPGQGSGRNSVVGWQGNSAECPANPPGIGESCDLGEGATCAYWYQLGDEPLYTECGCWEQTRDVTRWACKSEGVANGCPMVQPTDGTNCFGHVGVTCSFPALTSCSCPFGTASPTWSCGVNPAGVDDAGLHRPGPPDTGSAGKAIKDLSPAEASAWCSWYTTTDQPPGVPVPVEKKVGADGYISNLGGLDGVCAYLSEACFFADACLSPPGSFPPSQCVQNLQVQPCEATLGELTDCVMTLFIGFPQPHGCGRFFAAPHCEGTIAHFGSQLKEAGSDCSTLRVR